MYAFALIAHSWLRYVVLGLGIWLLIEAARAMRGSAPFGAGHERLHKAFLSALDTQLLLGLALYFVFSPIAGAALENMGAAMKDPQLRYWGVEHIMTMLIALAIAHIGRSRSRKREGKERFRTVLKTQLAWLVLTLLAIPWPNLDVGRPLFRF